MTVLRPTRWQLGCTLVFWLWRVASLGQRARYGAAIPWTAVSGFVLDAVLVAGLFALSRLFVPGDGGVPGRRARIGGHVVSAMLVFASMWTRGADLAFCALTGGHFNSAGFLYITWKNGLLLRDGDGPLLLLFFVVSLVALPWVLSRDRRAFRELAARAVPRRRRLGVLWASAILGLSLPVAAGFDAGDDEEYRYLAESSFVHEWLIWRGVLSYYDQDAAYTPPEAQLDRFAAKGLLPARPRSSRYPLVRQSFDRTPLPYPRTGNATRYGKPNVVFTLVEQLNDDFVHRFSGELEGVMPQTSRIADRVTRFTDFHSTSAPTIHALVTMLCGVHCAATYRELNKGEGSEQLVHTPYTCLPQVLREAGYRTVFIQGGTKEFATKGDFLHAHGFEEVYGKADLAPLYPDETLSWWGYHDDVLVDFAKKQIRRLEQQRAADGRPYFLMMLTLDTHSPGLPPPNCREPRQLREYTQDRNSRLMVRGLYCTDRSLGQLGRFILDKPRSDYTMWAITGDHPTYALKFVLDMYRKRGEAFDDWFGKLPLMLHDPMHELPEEVDTLSGSADFAPTILHLLGIVERPNSMYGKSIFGERRNYPELVGRKPPKYVALYRKSGVKNLSPAQLRSLCRKGAPLLERDSAAMGACDLLAWMGWQDRLWRDKRLFPPDTGR